MSTTTLENNIREISESVTADPTTKTVGTLSHYDVIRQGDLYIVCIPARPEGELRKERQLAPGTTQGSRHVLDGDATIVTPRNTASIANEINSHVKGAGVQSELVGPAFTTGKRCTVTHPEHGDVVLPGDTTFVITYQRMFADEIKRVMD